MIQPPSAPASRRDSDRLPPLDVVDLACRRGNRRLFGGVSFRVEPGQAIWLRGRNGRGKTSLLRILAGLSTPAAGEVLLDGQPLQRLGPQWRRRSLYIAHANALKDDLTVAECLRFLGALHGSVPSAAAIDQALALLGITRCTHALVRTLSQGQRRRAALARLALPQPPSVWLLDEPFDALDVEGVDALHGLLSAHARRGGSALMTSHQPITLADPVPEAFDLDAFAVPT
jgi:heme exporter protein A